MNEATIGIKENAGGNRAPVGVFMQNRKVQNSKEDKKPVRAKEFNKSFQIEIHRGNLVPNPLNEQIYDVTEGLDELKESILMNGLINNLVVHQVRPNDGAKYQIVSGERRYRAIMLLSESEYREVFPKGIKCNVESAQIDEFSKLLRTVAANRDVRDRNPETVAKEVEMIMQRLQEEKASGREVPKNVAEYIAKTMNMSVSMVKKYQNYAKIIPELREETAGMLRVPDIEQFGRLTEAEQKAVALKLREKKAEGEVEPKLSGEEIAEIKDKSRKICTEHENADSAIIKKYQKILKELERLYKEYGSEKVKVIVSKEGYKYIQL